METIKMVGGVCVSANVHNIEWARVVHVYMAGTVAYVQTIQFRMDLVELYTI